MNLRTLLLIQAFATLATFITIIISPSLIPQSFDIKITPNQNLLPYLIGAAELSLAYLSFIGTKTKNIHALKIICNFFIAFHFATALVCFYAIVQGASLTLIGNIAFRLIMVVMFYYYGIFKALVFPRIRH